uniref:Replication-associated protein n=1 Tax=Cressdnaviricota sp. TaxID=2748378 RepID=A0A6M3YPF6_9VIRU|nr:MAG: replication-associated protein [Cressdnaviricota sp.]QJI53698.1 MAG: replication-associated protein [Cressdnaviricota sp.]QJI53700.1 MAG: replication-associated protein [Cressdnaviricota sp.]QKN88872.1 MAG: replication-associated protein [Cressdnaviricota sp.]
MSKQRNYSCTLNNWTPEEYDSILQLDTLYTCIGKEIGKESEIPHLHFQLCFKNPVSFESLKKKLSRARIEKTNSVQDYVNYSKKDNDYYEKGVCPVGQGKRTDLDNIRDQLKEGKSMRQIVETASSYQSIKTAECLMKYNEKKRDFKTVVTWCYGATQTGKSYYAREYLQSKGYGDYYESMDTGRWFDGYDAHEAVIIDDIRENFMSYNSLLKFLDKYGYRVETKGGSRQFLAKELLITSPIHPREMFSHIGEDINQILRRIDTIVFFQYDSDPEIDIVHQKLKDDLLKKGSWNSSLTAKRAL